MTHYTRAQWGARAPRAGNPSTPGVKGVAVHYNGPAMRISPDRCNCAALVRQIQNFHMDGRGWSDIAYDVVACPHGHTFQGRLGTRNGTGANGTASANRDYKAVMGLIGDGETPSPDLKRAILSGIAMCRKAGAGPRLTGHRDHQSTACPGSALYAWVKAGAPAPPITEDDPPTPLPPEEDDMPLTDQDIAKVATAVHDMRLGRSDATVGVALERAATLLPALTARVAALESVTTALAADKGIDREQLTRDVAEAVRAGLRRAGGEDPTPTEGA